MTHLNVGPKLSKLLFVAALWAAMLLPVAAMARLSDVP